MPEQLCRFYSSPVNERTNLNPLQLYGPEIREPSVLEKPKLLRRVTDALRDTKEEFLQHFKPNIAANKTARSTRLILHDRNCHPLASCQKGSMKLRQLPRTQCMPNNSFGAHFSPSLHRRLEKKLTWWSSFLAKSRNDSGSESLNPSPPAIISSAKLWQRLGG